MYGKITVGLDSCVLQNGFVMDSGASEHMSNNIKLFTEYKKVDNKYITIGDGTRLKVQSVGNIEALAFQNNLGYISSVLTNVLHVPELTVNLFSVIAAVDKEYTMVTNREYCEFHKDGKAACISKRCNDFYVMDFKSLKMHSLV